jgi:SNF2 family DNA or RNA helicase
MPERIDTVIRVPLPPSRMVEYKQLEREFLIQINDNEVVAYNAATLAGKLLQYCNGAMYTDELKNWTEIHSAKLDAIDDIISENSDENLLIAYNYKTDLIRLQARYPDAVVLDSDLKTIEQWNSGNIKMLLAHPASAGHGLNLQHGGSIIVWFGLNWSLELYQQFNGRLRRQGQTKPVRIVHIVADGCIDDKVMKAIENKAQTQDELLNALKIT